MEVFFWGFLSVVLAGVNGATGKWTALWIAGWIAASDLIVWHSVSGMLGRTCLENIAKLFAGS